MKRLRLQWRSRVGLQMTKVLFIGSNPSVRSPDNSPFHPNTRSRIILDAWIRVLGCEASFMNLSDHPTPSNEKLRASDIDKDIIQAKISQFADYRIVGLGQTV